MTADDPRDKAKDIASDAAEGATAQLDAAGGTLSSAVDKAADISSQARQAAQAAFDRAKNGVADLREQLPDSASEAVDAGRRAYVQGSERLGRQVSRQPIEALLLAGAIGYLVGWAANRS